MRILQISSASSFGGGERYLADLTNALVERGHELYVAVRPHSPLPRHLHLPSDRIFTLPLRNALDVPSAHELERFVRRNGIEIVHAHMARDYSLASYAARRNSKTKFIATRHVLFQLNRLHRHTLARATRVIAVSNAVAQQLRASGVVDEKQIAVIPNGIEVERFSHARAGFDRVQFLRSMGLPVDCLLVGSIGELRTLKRHDDFIRAAAIVAARFPETQFVLAGLDTSASGEVRKHLETLVNELGLSERFYFLGWLDDAEKLLCAMDVFVSASETESFGLAIVEAMAAGTAVVATATEGAREVIEDQKTGLLVPIGDVDRIAGSVINLLSDSDKRRHIATQSAQSAATKFSLTRMVDEVLKAYRS
ncbi:MAG TPA: glycosyltransferase family 4 protein [Pyrinomonadaceae bacterium]|nr:glycosyltransferase family 4 protein [Pyrinomonadaceae bacterium]